MNRQVPETFGIQERLEVAESLRNIEKVQNGLGNEGVDRWIVVRISKIEEVGLHKRKRHVHFSPREDDARLRSPDVEPLVARPAKELFASRVEVVRFDIDERISEAVDARFPECIHDALGRSTGSGADLENSAGRTGTALEAVDKRVQHAPVERALVDGLLRLEIPGICVRVGLRSSR
jgi:hypothetical protein